jgi:hypothetical protein
VTMVCMIALAMTICSGATSATQFAIYMSLANLGASAGSKTYGVIAELLRWHGHQWHRHVLFRCDALSQVPI